MTKRHMLERATGVEPAPLSGGADSIGRMLPDIADFS